MNLFETLAESIKPQALEMVSAKIVVMSHLSDVQNEVNMQGNENMVNDRLNFVKYIMFHCSGDLTKEINPDELWKKFKSR